MTDPGTVHASLHRGNHKSPEPQTRLLQCFFIWNSTSGTFVPSYQGAPKAAV